MAGLTVQVDDEPVTLKDIHEGDDLQDIAFQLSVLNYNVSPICPVIMVGDQRISEKDMVNLQLNYKFGK